MARATRRRTIAVPRAAVWELVSDPYSLPRWWPRTTRVEDVEPGDPAEGRQWTTVLQTTEGRGVRADFRCSEAVDGERYGWRQQVEGTPFERHLRGSSVEIALEDAGAGETELALSSVQALRGLSRLGSPLMRRGQAALLEEALDGVERALL
ncbi:MAG TPA: SRPBCC family protein [Solirubrobacterales bacterium]|nr:SRPBCC family protein [Solirubrobacterales bacterium]